MWIRCAVTGVLCGALGRAPAQDVGAPPASQPADGPRLQMSATVCDFGQVWEGEAVQRDIIVTNVGTAPLTLVVGSSCNCTTPTKPKSPLAPGESSMLSISYDTVKRRKGPIQQRLTLTTNDPAQRTVEIPVQGHVKPLYTGEPAEGLYFNYLRADARSTKSIKLRTAYDGPYALRLQAGQKFGPFQIELKEVAPGREYELSATTTPPLAEGATRVEILLETGLSRSPLVRIPLTLYVQPDVVCVPTQLWFNRQLTVAREQPVDIRYRADKALQITAVKPSHESIRCQLLPPAPPTADGWVVQRVRVTLPPGRELPPGDARVEIVTDAAEARFQKFVVAIREVKSTLAPGVGPGVSGVPPTQAAATQPAARPEQPVEP